jgi:formylglycine-generating enzyme required for sulfatase activity
MRGMTLMNKGLSALSGQTTWEQRASGPSFRRLAWVWVFLGVSVAAWGVKKSIDAAGVSSPNAGLEAAKTKMSDSVFEAKPGDTLEVLLGEDVKQTFCFVPAGDLTMGISFDKEGWERPEKQVQVTLKQSFWLAKTEVTQAQWRVVVGGVPSSFKGENLPVESITWHDAQDFIERMNSKGLLPAGWKWALPTEAQWEYACRAGQTRHYSGGSLDASGWYSGNSNRHTHEVGAMQPNPWGLHDMNGNVSEWCADWYGAELAGGTDPKGCAWGFLRVRRGGSWGDGASKCSSAYRDRLSPDVRDSLVGFRPALVRTY